MGKKKASIYDIAKKVGVSPAAVSYVINGKNKVSPATKEKILKAMDEMGYAIDRAASSLSSGKSALIGVCFPLRSQFEVFSDNPFYSEFLASFSKEAGLKGYDVVIGYVQSPDSFEKWILSRGLDGIVIFGLYSPEIFRIIRRHHIPLVLSDVYDEVSEGSIVRVDDELGGYLAGCHLIEKGLTKIAFAGGNLNESKVDLKRLNGLRKALAESNLTTTHVFESPTTVEGGCHIADLVAEKLNEIDAVFCGSDIVAIGLMRRLQELGISIPNQISVIGFDDLNECRYVYPALTTIRQDVSQKGKLAAQSLLRLIDEPDAPRESHILQPTLVIRNTVRK